MLELHDVNVSFNRIRVIKDLSFDFHDNRFYLIQARNGSGKTTLFNAIMDLLPYSGTITKSFAKSEVFYLPNDFVFDSALSGKEYIKYYQRFWQSTVADDIVIEMLGISEFINRKTGEYSLGMKQLLVFALYLVSDTKWWLIDELNNGLDEKNLALVLGIINEMRPNKTILYITHQIEDIQGLADITLKLSEGKLHE